MFKKNDRGMAIVGAILLMLVLVVLGQAMVMLTNHESIQEVRGRLRDSALYIADAGIERAIYRIKNSNYTDFTENIGLGTGSSVGQSSVTITSLGSDRYRVDSIGYVPSISDERGKRKIRVVVEFSQGIPDEAITLGGTGTIDSGVEIFGVIFSNGPIVIGSNVKLKPDSNGNAAIYSASTNTVAIDIGNNFSIDPDDQSNDELRARGGIAGQGNIKSGDDPVIVENDTSSKTETKSDLSYIDEQALLDSVDETNYTFGGLGEEDPPGSGRIVFNNNVDIYLDGKVYLYTGGVEFRSNINFFGQGTIVVSTSSGGGADYDYGIKLQSNIYGETDNTYAQVNLIVLNGEWYEKDIYIKSNIMVEGLIQGKADIETNSNVDIKGLLIAGGDVLLNSNVSIIYQEPVFELPSESTGGVTIISWQEIK